MHVTVSIRPCLLPSIRFSLPHTKYINLPLVLIIMRRVILIGIFLAICIGLSAQKTLVLEKIGTMSRFGYHLGDDIKIRTKTQNVIVHSYIWGLTDTTITIGPRTIIPLTDVSAVYRHYYFPKLMNKILFIAGAGYFVLDSFNNLINRERVFNPQTMIISASLIGVSLAIIPAVQRKCKVGIRWKLKVMDIRLD
jgi:hypothetical protein